ncbi:hypothetical protein Lal_00042051 [Lupinus albus]|nr:hypothetical protein Lal_00042051 [Lupinus albus]
MGVQGRTPKDKPFGDHKHCWKSRITRSGCVYVPPEVERGPSAVFKGKGKTTEYVEEEVNEGLPDEFLKIIKQSEYRVVDLLNKNPARMSLLSLLMSSKAHKNVTEEALETSFQGLEIENTTILVEAPLMNPYPSDASLMMPKVMIRKGYQPGGGLGKYGQSREEVIVLKVNKDRYGLGYTPTREDRLKTMEEKKRRCLTRLGQLGYNNATKLSVPHISQNFVSGGVEFSRMVALVEEEGMEETHGFVFMCPPGTFLKNWSEEPYASVTLGPT